MKITLDELLAIYSYGEGSNLNQKLTVIKDEKAVIDTLLTDSRSLIRPSTSLFFAINTPGGNDGHRFMREIYDKGVRNFVANYIPDDMADVTDANLIIVNDVIDSLQATSSLTAWCDGLKVVAITGSRGKTTLKEWIFQLMEPLCEIARSPRSYNSQIGVPLSMWEIENTTRLALIEAGISKHGEMDALSACIGANVVIFTNIGDAHADGFDSMEEKAREKAKIICSSTDLIIFNQDSVILRDAIKPYLRDGLKGKGAFTWSLSDPSATLFIQTPTFTKTGLTDIFYRYKGESHTLQAPIANAADMENAANALAFMLSQDITPGVIAERFAKLHKISTRLNVADGVNGCSVILDSYTSDFSSLHPAIDFMMRRKTADQTPLVIMSDIMHETSGGTEIYQAIADVIRESGVKKFIGIGKEMNAHRELFGNDAQFFLSTEDFMAAMSPSDFISEIILLKGSPDYNFASISEMLESRKHETVLEVNLDAMVSNYNYFRSNVPSGTGIVCMVKASGYGAGSYEIAKTLQDCGAAYLAVAVLDEGIDLRKNGIRMPIMVMNPKVANYRSMFANNLEPEIYSLDMLTDVIREAKRNNITDYPIHLKLDTGMHRTGFLPEELGMVMDIILEQNAVRLSSMFSHLATADCVDMDDYTLLQLSRFKEMTEYILSRCPYPVKRHVLNSAGILRFPEYHYDMVRLGIGLYGANTLSPETEKPLAVVSTLRTVIIAIREWEAGETIGYGRKGVLTRKSKVATIPIGYADGMNRHFGRGDISVLVNGQPAPTVGNICMDACMIDVTGIDCKVGDAVEIFGEHAPLQRLADTLDTIPYEILTSVSPRVKRVYYRE